MKKLLRILILCLCLCLILPACSKKKKNVDEEPREDAPTVSVLEKEPEKEKKPQKEKKEEKEEGFDLFRAYRAELDSIASGDGVSGGYALYDIDGDGTPEMIVRAGTCEADTVIYICFEAEREIERLDVWQGPADIVPLGKEKAIMLHYCHMGYEQLLKVDYSGGTCEVDSIIDGREVAPDEEYIQFSALRLTDIKSDKELSWDGNPSDNNGEILKKFNEEEARKAELERINSGWKQRYRSAIGRFGTEEFYGYALYDLDRDGYPEMLMQTGNDFDGRVTFVIDNDDKGNLTVTEVSGARGELCGWYDESTVVFLDFGELTETVSALRYSAGTAATEMIIERAVYYDVEPLGLETLTMYGFGDERGLDWTGNPVDYNAGLIEALR